MSPTNLIARRPQGLQGHHVLVAFIAFFGTIFLVNGALIYEAISTHTGLVANEPYRKGLAYNERIGADERQARLNWTETLQVGRDGHVKTWFMPLTSPTSSRFTRAVQQIVAKG